MQSFALTFRGVLIEANLSALPLQALERKGLLQTYDLERLKLSSCSESLPKPAYHWHTFSSKWTFANSSFVTEIWNAHTLYSKMSSQIKCCHWDVSKGEAFCSVLEVVRSLWRMLKSNMPYRIWLFRYLLWKFESTTVSMNVKVIISR